VNQDPTAEQRKKDHIDLALRSQVIKADTRFYYEPMLAGHPESGIAANLGIAQLEELVDQSKFQVIKDLVSKLEADGLIIHVNPLQEGMQPEGDLIKYAPIKTIEKLLDHIDVPLIVKEVGQGMGYRSLEALLKLPLQAVDFAAHGGTNFTKLELLRTDDATSLDGLTKVGHSAEEMVSMVNQIAVELGDAMHCKQIIISGGVKDFLDGYYRIFEIAKKRQD